jgi:hypothetical protein
MADTFESVNEAIKQANEAYTAAISTLTRAVQDLPNATPSSDREPLIENVVGLARMSKNAIITAIELGFELWERQVRQTSALGRPSSSNRLAESAPAESNPVRSNPIEVWAENWRKATEAFVSSSANEELRRQAQTMQSAFVEGIRVWQRLWQPEKR